MEKSNDFEFGFTYKGHFAPLAAAVFIITGVGINEDDDTATSRGINALVTSHDTWLIKAITLSKAYHTYLKLPQALRDCQPSDDDFLPQYIASRFLKEVGGLIGLKQLREEYIAKERQRHLVSFIQNAQTAPDKAPDVERDIASMLNVVHGTINADGDLEFEGGELPPGIAEAIREAYNKVKKSVA